MSPDAFQLMAWGGDKGGDRAWGKGSLVEEIKIEGGDHFRDI